MSTRKFADATGLTEFWAKVKAYVTNLIPTKVSDLTNDSGFVADGSYVHTDNNFTSAEKTKLSGIASGAEVNVNADWNASSGDAQILNKPTNLQTTANLVTSVSSASTDSQYPSAKLLYDTVGNIESLLAAI